MCITVLHHIKIHGVFYIVLHIISKKKMFKLNESKEVFYFILPWNFFLSL